MAAASPFEDYWFAGEGSNFTCLDNPFKCNAPDACTRHKTTKRRYCAEFGKVNWAGATNCNVDGSTRKCGEGEIQWCCLKDTERCTTNNGQINVCWSTDPVFLDQIKEADLKSVFTSLSKAKPKATSYPFDPSTLLAAQTSSAGQSSSTSASGTAAPIETSPSPNQPASGGLAGGAIAGIVIGAIAGLLLGGLAVWWVMMKRRRANADAMDPPPPDYQDNSQHNEHKGFFGHGHASPQQEPIKQYPDGTLAPHGAMAPVRAHSTGPSEMGDSTVRDSTMHSGSVAHHQTGSSAVAELPNTQYMELPAEPVNRPPHA